MSAPSLSQQFILWAWLDRKLAAFRKNQLVPQAEREMPSGSRLPAMFGGRNAGWASMPEASQPAAAVTDEGKLLAWAGKHYPEKIEHPVEVKVDAGLIEFLQEHRPESLHTATRVDPQWVADICQGLAGKDGYYITAAGEKLPEVPGIEVPEARPPAPRVNLAGDADEIIATAWRDGLIDLPGLLALPAPDARGEAPHAA